MSPEKIKESPEFDSSAAAAMNFKETELTLGLPGESRKRGFSDTIDLNSETSNTIHCGGDNEPGNDNSTPKKPPSAKGQVVGWPPVKTFRKKVVQSSGCKYVKVAVDGAPFLRKVDLEMYGSYQQLLGALEDMFTCFTIRNYLNEKKLMNPVNGIEYVATYEDRDGDWMLVGDVPWNMFVESCKRLRLMENSEAIGLAPRTPPNSSSTNC